MIRKADFADIEAIMKIIRETIVEMRSCGNTQWDESYPRKEDFLNDIQRSELYISERDGNPVGFACINKVEPAEYADLTGSTQQPAIIIHRMAVDLSYRRSGIGTELMEFAEDFALKDQTTYVKTDTYSINAKMNALFAKRGYKQVGEMRFRGKEKVFYCYEKVLNSNTCPR